MNQAADFGFGRDFDYVLEFGILDDFCFSELVLTSGAIDKPRAFKSTEEFLPTLRALRMFVWKPINSFLPLGVAPIAHVRSNLSETDLGLTASALSLQDWHRYLMVFGEKEEADDSV